MKEYTKILADYAAGLKYLLLSMILYAPGLGFFLHARRQRGLPAAGL